MKVGRFAVAVSLTMLAFGAESVSRSALAWNPEPENRKQVQLDLSFRKLQREMVARHLSAEVMRIQMADWNSANAGLIKEVNKELAESMAPSPKLPPTPDPGAPPAPDGKVAEVFFMEAASYKARLARSIMESSVVKGDPEKGRFEIARRMSDAAVQKLDGDVASLSAVLRAASPDMEPPFKQEEMTDFTPAQKADAEIYAAIYQATRRPLARGEELRDRIAPLEESLTAKRKIIMAEDASYLLDEELERVKTLESLLNKLPQ